MRRLVVIAALAAVLAAAPAGAETCHVSENQFTKQRICVSSVLAPQADNT